ncbi:helix-turn-helix domain-containing protein [Flexivirga caeni]|uniref:helix-turn-helix domain-containing protein n=1 Tax=Flexivirga caeni TaxID=2294115 RepID=UPI001FE8055E|nr:helix-turn-helix transcriptional regulator [Flexivirga caeni]
MICSGAWARTSAHTGCRGRCPRTAFADVLGLHRTYVGGLERGERNLTLKAVERIAEAIEVDPVDLLTGVVASVEKVEPRFNLPANRSTIAGRRAGDCK